MCLIPPIDKRDMDDLVNRMKKIYRYYTPEWRFAPENPDAGTTLFYIFANMFMENIKRFNKVPYKNFIAFLNMLNTTCIPPKSSRAYVTFRLNDGVKEPVVIPAGTRVSAASKDGGESVGFETVDSIGAAPAVPIAAFAANGAKDCIIKVPDEVLSQSPESNGYPFSVYEFDDKSNLQEHSIFLGHKSLFSIASSALIELDFRNSTARYLEDKIKLNLASTEWAYPVATESGSIEWQKFDEVVTREQRLQLKKLNTREIAETVINGKSCKWIKCCINSKNTPELFDAEIDGIFSSVRYYDHTMSGGIVPEMVYHNDMQEKNENFYPFGEFFNLYDCFYFTCKEAFSKKEAVINIEMKLEYVINRLKEEQQKEIQWKLIMKESELQKPPPPKEIQITKVVWEYWNGKGWVKLFEGMTQEEIFLPAGEDNKKVLSFICPMDFSETYVNNHLNYWIRARIAGLKNAYEIDTVYCSPKINNLKIRYDYGSRKIPVEDFIARNNMQTVDLTESIRSSAITVRPFRTLECDNSALYIGFDRAPQKGPISILFYFKQKADVDYKNQLLEWEYLRQSDGGIEWAPLKVFDGTDNFNVCGTIVFYGASDFAAKKLFGADCYWIRALNCETLKDTNSDSGSPNLIRIIMNTTTVVQQESVTFEMLEPGFGKMNKEYALQRYPITEEKIWVNEVTVLAEDEISQLKEDNLLEYSEIEDEFGNITEFWIKWVAVDSMLAAGSSDRIYIIDKSTGNMRFGNGINGKIPPYSIESNIKAEYKIGGGSRGNVNQNTITNLESPVPFIKEVYNPLPSYGGCDTEKPEEAMKRGPYMLKHRNRAVTEEDFEWLAVQASRNIAKVRCLPFMDGEGKRDPGAVTLVVMPKDGATGDAFNSGVRLHVENYLREHTSALISIPGRIRVVEPIRLEINVFASVAVSRFDLAITIEKEVKRKLDCFLDTLNGGIDGNGWEIGKLPHISVFFTLLKTINGIDFIDKVNVSMFQLGNGTKLEGDLTNAEGFPYGIVANGTHEINVRVV